MTGGLDTLIKSDREFAVDKQSNDRGGQGREESQKKAEAKKMLAATFGSVLYQPDSMKR